MLINSKVMEAQSMDEQVHYSSSGSGAARPRGRNKYGARHHGDDTGRCGDRAIEPRSVATRRWDGHVGIAERRKTQSKASKAVPSKQASCGLLSLPWTESFCCCVQKPKDFFKKANQRRRQCSNDGKPVHTLDDAVSSMEEDSDDNFDHFALVESVHAMPSAASKLFTTLSLSVSGDSFTDVKFQLDSAATCNTLPYHHVRECGFETNICKADIILRGIYSSVGQSNPCSPNPLVLLADRFSCDGFTVQASIARAT